METVLIVSDNIHGFFANTVCGMFDSMDVAILKAGFDDEKLSEYMADAKLVMAVLSDEIDMSSLFILSFKKKCEEHAKKVILFGSDDKIQGMKHVLPFEMIADEIERNLDLEQFKRRIYFLLSGGEHKDERKHILVVDDSGPMLRTIMGWLEVKYKVSLANSAAVARTVIDKEMPDLILLDYEMPICSGPQFLKRLREDEKTKNIPVIFLTAQSDSDSVKAVLELKPQGYILKTASGKKVMDKLDEFFGI